MPSDFEVAQKVWEQALDLQKHFNDILFRLRSFFFLFLGAAATFAAKSDVMRSLVEHPASVLLLAPVVAVYALDRFYYHLLLVGAVEAARRIEEQHPALRLSETIRAANLSSTLFGRVTRGREKVTFFYAMPMTVAAGLLASGHFGWLGGVVAAVLVAAAFASIERRQGLMEEERFSTERPAEELRVTE